MSILLLGAMIQKNARFRSASGQVALAGWHSLPESGVARFLAPKSGEIRRNKQERIRREEQKRHPSILAVLQNRSWSVAAGFPGGSPTYGRFCNADLVKGL